MHSIAKRLYLLATFPHYLDEQHLTVLNIKQTGLDLRSGEPRDGSETFIHPFSTDRIHRILNERKPWVEHMLFYGPLDPKYDALGLIYTLYHYLWHTEDDSPCLIEATSWRVREMEGEEGEVLVRRNMDGADWVVWLLFDKMDGQTPHISCLLADENPIKDDQLSNAEVWCILATINHRARLKEYRNRIIPVTVISTSERKLRIVQGYVDGQDRLQVRKSPIIDFGGVHVYFDNGLVDEQNGLQLIELVLSWCLGDTVGCTHVSECECECQIASAHSDQEAGCSASSVHPVD
ncbi:hypothetical protein F4861DRAFT_523610 [Xylaria intraflava]|nr:hypothetical protein F4861DRAFT_523610 [Xylaria intraflava]